MAVGFYVSAIDGAKKCLMLGPFDTKEEAETKVKPTLNAVYEVDARAWFMAWGTMKLEAAALPAGNANKFMEGKF